MIGDFPLKSKLVLRSKQFVRLWIVLVQTGKKEVHIGECGKKHSLGVIQNQGLLRGKESLDLLPLGEPSCSGVACRPGTGFSCTPPAARHWHSADTCSEWLCLWLRSYDCMYSTDQYSRFMPNMPQSPEMFVPSCRQGVPLNFWIYCGTIGNSLSFNS